MSNIGPNMIHAMDLAHLEDMNVVTNELDESVIRTPDGDITDADIMVGLYGSNLRPWQSKALRILLEMDPKDPALRKERQRLKNHTFWERYGNQTITGNKANYIIVDSVPDITWDENHYLTSIYSTKPFDPDRRDEHDWKRNKFQSGPATPPSDAKRAKLRDKRKKRK